MCFKTFLLILKVGLFSLSAHATDITIEFSPKFAEKLTDDLGEREGERLSEKLRAAIVEQVDAQTLAKAEAITITIQDAEPNRPTFKQLGDKPGLSYTSFGNGGLSVTAEINAPSLEESVIVKHKKYGTDIRHARFAATWSDANRSTSIFTRKLNTALGEVP